MTVRIIDRGKQGKLGIVTSAGRVRAAVWSADSEPTIEAVKHAWKTDRRVFEPYDESAGAFLQKGQK